jgi:hypothetical protein
VKTIETRPIAAYFGLLMLQNITKTILTMKIGKKPNPKNAGIRVISGSML